MGSDNAYYGFRIWVDATVGGYALLWKIYYGMGDANYGNYFQILVILRTDTSTTRNDDRMMFGMLLYLTWMTRWTLPLPKHNWLCCGLRNSTIVI